jgi:S1-C subfamily serine protease
MKILQSAFPEASRFGLTGALISLVSLAPTHAADAPDVIQTVKASVVAVGTFEKLRSPAFIFRETGFTVGDGSLVATNAHGLPAVLDGERTETLIVQFPDATAPAGAQRRSAKVAAVDLEHDLALLRIEGPKLTPLVLGDSSRVREGQSYLFTGFPIGDALGLIPATHRAMVAALAPIAIPTGNARQLDAPAIKRLSANPFPVFQLDGTAYPGNSGSPLYDPATGEVIGIINMVYVKASRETALLAALTQPSGITYAIPAQPLKLLLHSIR